MKATNFTIVTNLSFILKRLFKFKNKDVTKKILYVFLNRSDLYSCRTENKAKKEAPKIKIKEFLKVRLKQKIS